MQNESLPEQASPPSVAPQSKDVTRRKTLNIQIIVGISFAVLFLLVTVIYFLFLPGKIQADDLTRETAGATSYLRPKQWQRMPELSLENMSGYGVLEGRDTSRKLVAAVLMNETASIPGFTNASDTAIAQLRQELLQGSSADKLNPMTAWGALRCDAVSNSTPEADTKRNDTMIGLVISSSTCEAAGKKMTTKMRAVIGKDGTARIILVMAGDKSWAKNKAVFQSILDSIEQTNAHTVIKVLESGSA